MATSFFYIYIDIDIYIYIYIYIEIYIDIYIWDLHRHLHYIYKLTERPAVLLNAIFAIRGICWLLNNIYLITHKH